jgi:hypothetical protein
MKTQEDWRHNSIRSQISALNGSESSASRIRRVNENNTDYTG